MLLYYTNTNIERLLIGWNLGSKLNDAIGWS